jgi:hypothetical protein
MKNLHTFEEFLNEQEEALNEDAKDKIPANKLSKIGEDLTKICKHYSGSYWKTLFDPQQTHAIYGAGKDNMDDLKEELTKAGAKKFRIVKNGSIPILCFDATNMA